MEILVTAELIGLLISIGLIFFNAGKVREQISNLKETIKALKKELKDELNELKNKIR